jgi:hypothetical protein
MNRAVKNNFFGVKEQSFARWAARQILIMQGFFAFAKIF